MSLSTAVSAIAVWIIILAMLETRWPVILNIPLRNYVVNASCMLVLAGVTVPLSIAAGAAAVWAASALPAQLFLYRLEDVSVGLPWFDPVLRIALLTVMPLALSDLWMSLTHRLEHRLAFMWAFHRVHHSETQLNVMSTFRDHPAQHIWRSFVPMFLTGLLLDLGPDTGAHAASYSVVFLYCLSTLGHSNLRLEVRWLDRVLVTPQVHRIHHSVSPEHIDRNYVDVFPIFDIIFGSYVAPRRGEFPSTGLTSQERINTFWETQTAPFAALWGRARFSQAGEKGSLLHQTQTQAQVRGVGPDV